jgi:hypothetical protein
VSSKRGPYELSLTLAVVSLLPTLEALDAAARAWAFRLGRDRRLGAFQAAVSLVPRRAG